MVILMFLLSKTQRYYQRYYHQETIKNYPKFLAKDLKDQFIGMNMKQKEIKMRQMNLDIFSNQTLL